MPSILSYINPFSNQHNAIHQYKSLSKGDKIKTAIATIIAGLFSFGLAATPVFRLLVGRFKKFEKDALPKEQTKINRVAVEVLPKKATVLKSQPLSNQTEIPKTSTIDFSKISTSSHSAPTKEEEEALKLEDAERKDMDEAFRKFQEELLKGKAPADQKKVMHIDTYDDFENYGATSDDDDIYGEIFDDDGTDSSSCSEMSDSEEEINSEEEVNPYLPPITINSE